MSNQGQNPNAKKYDLSERTARFGGNIIDFVGTISDNSITRPLKSQAVRSGTSIGANYMEADGAESRKDFFHKIGICKKEAKETMHWLRMIARTNMVSKEKCIALWKEAHELALIFSAIIIKK
ncbi:MAG: four helix bundle protein [Patescibacteria group bacterium]|nr:four helix bundle protein [Patescibacteria group bacterium]